MSFGNKVQPGNSKVIYKKFTVLETTSHLHLYSRTLASTIVVYYMESN